MWALRDAVVAVWAARAPRCVECARDSWHCDCWLICWHRPGIKECCWHCVHGRWVCKRIQSSYLAFHKPAARSVACVNPACMHTTRRRRLTTARHQCPAAQTVWRYKKKRRPFQSAPLNKSSMQNHHRLAQNQPHTVPRRNGDCAQHTQHRPPSVAVTKVTRGAKLWFLGLSATHDTPTRMQRAGCGLLGKKAVLCLMRRAAACANWVPRVASRHTHTHKTSRLACTSSVRHTQHSMQHRAKPPPGRFQAMLLPRVTSRSHAIRQPSTHGSLKQLPDHHHHTTIATNTPVTSHQTIACCYTRPETAVHTHQTRCVPRACQQPRVLICTAAFTPQPRACEQCAALPSLLRYCACTAGASPHPQAPLPAIAKQRLLLYGHQGVLPAPHLPHTTCTRTHVWHTGHVARALALLSSCGRHRPQLTTCTRKQACLEAAAVANGAAPYQHDDASNHAHVLHHASKDRKSVV